MSKWHSYPWNMFILALPLASLSVISYALYAFAGSGSFIDPIMLYVLPLLSVAVLILAIKNLIFWQKKIVSILSCMIAIVPIFIALSEMLNVPDLFGLFG